MRLKAPRLANLAMPHTLLYFTMNDGAPTPPHPTAKKLPFNATALRKAALLNVGTIAKKKGSENDELDLFRRSKEMEPLIAADHERRIKKQRQEYTRRRSAESSAKRVLDAHTKNDVVAEAESGKLPQEPQNSTPVTSELAAEDELSARLVCRNFLDTFAKVAYTF